MDASSKIIKISIAGDFSLTPGARYRSDGPKSGEEFREDFLEKYFKDPSDDTIIEVFLDDVRGYTTSFLEEAFGGLARKYGKEVVKKRIKIISKKRLLYKEKAEQYIENTK
ncbi:MAG: STAS-like domain-containing protein [Bacteroidetes bacterium]|nr:STAS-like domain-containing protein [Bacteroidota bacterium]